MQVCVTVRVTNYAVMSFSLAMLSHHILVVVPQKKREN